MNKFNDSRIVSVDESPSNDSGYQEHDFSSIPAQQQHSRNLELQQFLEIKWR